MFKISSHPGKKAEPEENKGVVVMQDGELKMGDLKTLKADEGVVFAMSLAVHFETAQLLHGILQELGGTATKPQ